VNGRINIDAINLIYNCKNLSIPVTLITRHRGDLSFELSKFALSGLFTRIILLNLIEKKSKYIVAKNPIFIDDSFRERIDVSTVTGFPCFDVSEISVLLNSDLFGEQYDK
jgi:hypothetical protein